MRNNLEDLDDNLAKIEEEIEENGVPICDYMLNYLQIPTIKDKFRESVRRALVFSEFKRKKNTRLTKLIAQLRAKREEEQQLEKKK